MEGSLGVNRELALLAAAPGRAVVAGGATIYDNLVVSVSPILISLDGFSSPERAVRAERRPFISEQSVSAAFGRRHGQASFTSGQAAMGAVRALGARGPLPELLQLVVLPVLRLLPLLLGLLLLRRARRARRARGAWKRGTLL